MIVQEREQIVGEWMEGATDAPHDYSPSTRDKGR